MNYNLDDKQDITRATKDFVWKANFILYKFSSMDPFLKSYLIKLFTLSLFGSPLWSLSSPSLKMFEIALNKILRKIWNLPYQSHSGIVHCIAQINTISNLIFDRFCSFYSRCTSSKSHFLSSIFHYFGLSAIHLLVITLCMVTIIIVISHIRKLILLVMLDA